MSNKRANKCTPSIIEKVGLLIEQETSWKNIARIIGIAEKTLERWRKKGSETYRPKFVEAIEKAREKISTDKTRRDQRTQSQFHYLHKVVKESRVIDVRTEKSAVKLPPPKMPPSHFSVKMIRKYADEILDYEIPAGYTKDEMMIMCINRINELSKEIMVTVRQEISQAEPNQQAVKNVETNCGPEDKRWKFKEELIHGVEPDSIADMFALVGIGSADKTGKN